MAPASPSAPKSVGDPSLPSLATLAIGFAAGLILWAAMEATPGASPGSLPTPGLATFAATLIGLALLALAIRFPKGSRGISIAAILLMVAFGLAPKSASALGVVVALPVVVHRISGGSLRFGIGYLASGIGLGLLPAALHARVEASPSTILLLAVAGLGLLFAIGFTLSEKGETPTIDPRGRFDVRAALALSLLVLVGLVASFGATQLAGRYGTPIEYGGLGSPSWKGGLSAFNFGFIILVNLVQATFAGTTGAKERVILAVAIFPVAIALTATPSPIAFSIGSFAVGIAALHALDPSIRRLNGVRRWLAPLALLLAGLLGAYLAAGLVRAFSRALPGMITVRGVEVSTRTEWGPILGFYALLALVVLLAHLAFVYEFGLAALSPDDDQDRLPILRKGFPKSGRGGSL